MGDRADDVEKLRLPLVREAFLGELVRELAGTLQDVIGLDDAAGYISVVGQRVGEGIDRDYRAALSADALDRDRVRDVLVDLKRRIGGGFRVVEEHDDRIVLANDACPFGNEEVRGRPALCMMTSNVFGVIAAENLGWAKVAIDEAIARGDAGCRVVVWLSPSDDSERAEGREYVAR